MSSAPAIAREERRLQRQLAKGRTVTVPQRIEALEQSARNIVGDGKAPNVYFVTDQGVVTTITRDREIALSAWRTLASRWPLVECAVEDRLNGVIADVSPESDVPGARLRRSIDLFMLM